MFRLNRGVLATAALLVLAGPASAQVVAEQVDLDVIARIRDEGLNRSQIPALAHHLTDVIGPRLTGSPGMKRANEWTAQTFRTWGLQNVMIEPWGEFGRGWEHVSYMARITQPWAQPLIAQPAAWSGSTSGTVEGPVLAIDAATVEELKAKYSGRLKGAFVLRDEHRVLGPEFDQRDRRFDADDLLQPIQQAGGRGGPPVASPEQQAALEAARAAAAQRRALQQALDSMALAEGAAAMLRQSTWRYGIILVSGGGSREAGAPEGLPILVVSSDQYGQLYRSAMNGEAVRIEANIQNRFHTDDTQAYNTLADLPGKDKADEYVMLGAHLDSWHSGTGATDNAAGSVVMMEAMRILKTLGLQPRRTVRIALWSGEEQGLLGSRAWVRNHAELHPKISAYVNVDNGTGRLRGIWDQSNEKAIPIFEQILSPFRDIGIVAVRHGNTGGTDHLAFDAAGVPGFNFIQDPIEYGFRTHHSNVDVYDELVIDDLKQAATIVAYTVYHLANREEMMPRKTPASRP